MALIVALRLSSTNLYRIGDTKTHDNRRFNPRHGARPRQRFLFDCDRTDPASDFVVALYFELDRTCEARSSIRAPVCLAVPACASADPARLRAVAEAFWLPRIEPAFDAIPAEVPLVFLDMVLLQYVNDTTSSIRSPFVQMDSARHSARHESSEAARCAA